MRAEQRVGIFVDIQNLYYTARNVYNARVNFTTILKDAAGDRPIVRAIAYGIKADMPEEQTFFDALKKAGFEVKLKELQSFYGGAKKGDWDVGIVMDIIKLLRNQLRARCATKLWMHIWTWIWIRANTLCPSEATTGEKIKKKQIKMPTNVHFDLTSACSSVD
jgi:hypothetical protein